MRYNAIYITESNFFKFLYDVEPNINFSNTSYINSIKKQYFESVTTPQPTYKAERILKSILKNNGCVTKMYAYTKEYWRKLGYVTDDDIRAKIYNYIKNVAPNKYDVCFDNDHEKYKNILINFAIEFNFDNESYYNDVHDYVFDDNFCLPVKRIRERLRDKMPSVGTQLNESYWLCRGFASDYAKTKISILQRERSNRCPEYYVSQGYSEDEAKNIVSDNQHKYSLCGKGKSKYWTDLGFDEKQSEELAKEFSRKSSVRCVEYWMSIGFTESEAQEKTKQYNPSSPEFLDYKKGIRSYVDKIKSLKRKGIDNWKKKSTRDKIIYSFKSGNIKRSSNAEIEAFNFLIENVDSSIKHESYIVVIPDDCDKPTQNNYFYSCDGYLKTDNGIIIIEYDGIVYHNDNEDIQRDDDILYLDKSIIGIIRIGQYFLKKGDIDNNIKIIKDAIQKIKNSTETRIVLK